MFLKKLASDFIYSKCNSYISVRNCVRRLPCVTINHHIHLQHNLQKKLFSDIENKHAYDILLKYATNLYKPHDICDFANHNLTLDEASFQALLNENWSRKSPKEIFDVFPKLGIYCTHNNLSITNQIFDTYIDNLTDNLKYASDEELLFIFDSLKIWPPTESVLSRNFIEVWAALDEECLSRYKSWSLDEMIKYLSCFYMLSLTKSSDYSFKALQKLGNKAKHLTPKQFVQTLFFVGVCRKPPGEMHSLEIQLENLFSKMTVDDLAIISMGFFKSKTPIRSLSLAKRICEVVIKESNRLHEVSLAALLKVIRYSMRVVSDDTIYRVLDKLQHEVPRLSVMCNVHLALLGSTTLVLHKQCLDKIAQKVMDSMSVTRIKDLERLVLTFGTFNYRPETSESFFNKVVEEVKKPERQVEIKKYPRSYACCISYLGLFDIYPLDCIQKILSEDFLKSTYAHFTLYGREILVLHNKAKIFGFESSVPLLSDKVATILAKKYTDYIPREDFNKSYNITERMMLEVITLLKNSRGSAYAMGDHILTHHQRGDVIIGNDKSGKPVPVTDKLESIKFGLIKPLPDTENDWIVLVIAGRNITIYGSNTPNGHFVTKLIELRKLGYKAAVVIWNEYSELKTGEEKLKYLNIVIESALNYKEP